MSSPLKNASACPVAISGANCRNAVAVAPIRSSVAYRATRGTRRDGLRASLTITHTDAYRLGRRWFFLNYTQQDPRLFLHSYPDQKAAPGRMGQHIHRAMLMRQSVT